MTLPRGIRNNNPGNIRRSDDQWKGLANEQKDEAFFTFESPKWGIRAMVRLLQVYREKHAANTLSAIVNRWAPPIENNTDAYMRGLSTLTGFEPDERLDTADYETVLLLVRGIVRWENGKPDGDDWYEQTVYEQGLRLAGVSPQKPLSKSRTTKGAAVASGAMVSATATLSGIGVPEELAVLLPTVLANASDQAVSIALLTIGIAGAVYAIWARKDDQRMGRL